MEQLFMSIIFVGYISLFLTSFFSATILPLSSEAALLIALNQGLQPWGCLSIATSGNVLGGLTNYLLGAYGKAIWLKRFGINQEKIESFEVKIKKYGYMLAFFSWLPFIGDPLTIALGFFRVSFWKVVILIILGKLLRYSILIIPFL